MPARSKGRTIENFKKTDFSVLGLDCSSATIGWGIVNEDLELLAYGHIKPLNSKYSEVERLNDVYCEISKLCEYFDPDEVAIEDILLFMKGKSQARTTTLLSAFNRVAALSAYHYTKKDIAFYPPQTVRKLLKQITNQTSGKISKEEVPNIIDKHIYNFLDTALYDKKGKLKKEMYDEADGIAVALAHILEREK